MLIHKYYLDIECQYPVADKPNFRDYANWSFKNGMIGVLCLEIDTDAKTKKEISFFQFDRPTLAEDSEEVNMLNEIFNNESGSNNILVTFNGRSFDVPILFTNYRYTDVEKFKITISNAAKRNRDLMDLCLCKKVKIKGGLYEIVKRLRNGNNGNQLNNQSLEKEAQYKDALIRMQNNKFSSPEELENVYNLIKEKNEIDIRVLPELENYLGLLFCGLNGDDKFTHHWR